MKQKIVAVVCCFFFVSFFSYAADWQREYLHAQSLFQNGKTKDAVDIWNSIVSSSGDFTLIGECYYWLGIGYLKLQNYVAAGKNLEVYLSGSDRKYYEDVIYQVGYLYFLEKRYRAAIEMLQSYLKRYPNGKSISSAYYWIGESLAALGLYDESLSYFQMVLDRYPTSDRYESAQYWIRLIGYKQNELVLQNIIKWSQEQYLSSLDKLKQREATLLQAIEQFQKRENQEKVSSLTLENEQLKKKIGELERKISFFSTTQSSQQPKNDEMEQKRKELENREILLNQKEETLRIWEERLKQRDKR